MELEDPYDIVGFKNPPRSTNADYRSKLALDAAQVGELRSLSSNIENEQDFQWTVLL